MFVGYVCSVPVIIKSKLKLVMSVMLSDTCMLIRVSTTEPGVNT